MNPGSSEAQQDPAAVFARAVALHQRGEIAPAIELYRWLLTRFPRHAQVLYLLGSAQSQAGNHAAGIELLDRSLAINPDNSEAQHNKGLALVELGRVSEALASFDAALRANPANAQAYASRGDTLRDQGRFDEARQSLARATELQPDFAAAHNGLGGVLHALGRFDEALASYRRALDIWPDFAAAHRNMGLSLHALDRFDEALRCHQRAVNLLPDSAEAHTGQGATEHALLRLEQALLSFDRALQCDPDYAQAQLNKSITLNDLGRTDEALDCLDAVIRLDPDHVEAHVKKAHALLRLGEYAEGWKLNEWRWREEQARETVRNYRQPLWLGQEPIAGKTIFIHVEQGMGDIIQFCRYVPMVATLGAKVIFEVPNSLWSLLSSLAGGQRMHRPGEPLPPFDLHCPIMSLPLAFGTTLQSIPADIPYLHADPERQRAWRQRLGPKKKLRVGLAWSGNPRHQGDRVRSLGLAALRPVIHLPVEFHSLQTEYRDEDRALLQDLPQISDYRPDFADTAALIEELDLVIAVDTSIAHLAGALGRPVWIMLPYMPDFRWLLKRGDSPWYPSATLFRQQAFGDWDSVIGPVAERLRTMIAMIG